MTAIKLSTFEDHVPSKLVSFDFELNWFDFETRTRKLVYELLQPSVTRATEDREVLFKHGKTIDNHRTRIDEVEYSLFSSEKPPTTIFEQIDNKLIEMETDRKVQQAKTNMDVDTLTKRIDEIKFFTSNIG